MTPTPTDGQHCLPTLSLMLPDTPPPLACLHCAATQASVLRDRQILDARLGYLAQCVCCDCETGSLPEMPRRKSGVRNLRLRHRPGDRLCVMMRILLCGGK